MTLGLCYLSESWLFCMTGDVSGTISLGPDISVTFFTFQNDSVKNDSDNIYVISNHSIKRQLHTHQGEFLLSIRWYISIRYYGVNEIMSCMILRLWPLKNKDSEDFQKIGVGWGLIRRKSKTVKILCIVLYLRMFAIIHLSKSIDGTTQEWTLRGCSKNTVEEN